MKVLYRRLYLLEEFTGFHFWQGLFFNYVVEEFATRDILHDEEQLLGCFDDFVELDDEGVADHF